MQKGMTARRFGIRIRLACSSMLYITVYRSDACDFRYINVQGSTQISSQKRLARGTSFVYVASATLSDTFSNSTFLCFIHIDAALSASPL